MTLRLLVPGDEAAVEAFLAARPDSSMIPRANLRDGGLAYQGAPLQGTWVGAFDAAGRLEAVGGHFWNGMVILQAPVRAAEITLRAVAESRREVVGLLGPHAQCVAARTALGRDGAPMRHDTVEDLYVLDLAELRVPALLAEGKVTCRHLRDGDLPRISQWRHDYHVEGLDATPGPELLAEAREEIVRMRERGADFLLEAEGEPVAFSGFNASLPGMVQVGGVYTPPAYRGRGYARAVVAASLLEARAGGATRSVLFTGIENHPARAAYLALGYKIEGDYGLLLFA